MKIQLICHASVMIETGFANILCDPWLKGKAFNDSWALSPEPHWNEGLLDRVTHLWISHEHPDHFHLPTLRGFPNSFRQRVVVMFQKNNSDKMFEAFRKIGYPNHMVLPHRKRVQLTPSAQVYCYHEGAMNSALAIIENGECILNINDAELRTPDCRLIKKDLNKIDVVLNQFSIAGFDGNPAYEETLPLAAKSILQNMVDNHRDLGAKVTVPFASFMYFCSEDNRHINRYANTPADVVKAFDKAGLQTAILYPGDVWQTDQPIDSASTLAKYAADAANSSTMAFEEPPPVPMEQIRAAFQTRAAQLCDAFPAWILKRLKPVVAKIPDLGTTCRFELATGMYEADVRVDTPDVIVNSQPLHFMFAYPFGLQTLGVSGRYWLVSNRGNWFRHRILLSLNNAELYLRPKYVLTSKTLGYLFARAQGGARQVVSRIIQIYT